MISFSTKRPVTVAMIASALCLLGFISWSKLPVQLLPELIMPEVYIGAGLQGASPLQIERDIVIPIEGEISQLENVHDINSNAGTGFATIRISFDHGTDMKFTLLKLQQRINTVQKQLPVGSFVRINHFDTADLSSYLMQLNIRGEGSLEALREMAERRVSPRLEQVDGIVNVRVGGGRRQNVGIVVDKDKCEALNVSIIEVQQKINAFHQPPQQAGRIVDMGKMWDVIVDGRVDNLLDLQNLIIRSQGPVLLRDVAFVGFAQEEQNSIYRVNGKSSVGIMVQKDNTINMLAVANEVLDQVEELNSELKELGYELVVGFSQAEMIQKAIDQVEKLALTGALLALLVLFLFLRNLRFVLILMVAIPISLLVTFNLMYAWTLSVNILSLCGLALAIGMLVDNGIVVMENIFTHFQKGKNPRQAAFEGTTEMARSVFAATGTTILVFLPVLFVESDAQLFVRELALSIIFPLSVSLVVALSIIPLLAGISLHIAPDIQMRHSRAAEIYRIFLKSVLRHRIRTVSAVVVLFLLSLFIGVTFIMSRSEAPPPERIETFITMPHGSTLARTNDVVENIEKNLAELKDIEEYRSNIQEEEASITIEFKPADEREKELNPAKIKEKIRTWNRLYRDTELSFENSANSGRGGGGGFTGGLIESSGSSLVLRGNDLQQLQGLSRQLERTLKDFQDIEENSVRSTWRGGTPELQIRGDRLRMALWGLSMREVMQALWTTRKSGANAQTPFVGEQGDVNINVRYEGVDSVQVEDIRELKIKNQSGALVPLREVATIRTDEGEGSITRHNQEREIEISYGFRKIAEESKSRLEQAENQVDRIVQDMRLPRGFTLEKKKTDESQKPYYWMLGIGTLLIFMFLAAQFESFFSPFVILGTIPTAIIGALFTLSITGTSLSIGSGAPMALLGLIVLLGIVVNNGIILLDRIAVLRSQDNYSWQRAVMIAGQSRVRPILMTSVTTVLGVFPLALKQGMELEMWPPFAITVIGGLTFSALSTLFFIPVLYVGLEQTRTWLQKIGLPLVLLASVATYGILYWYYDRYDSVLLTSVLVLPVWFALLALIYGIQTALQIRKEKARLATVNLVIQISNLTKIYGAPGRLSREWQKNRRRNEADTVEENEISLPWSSQALQNSSIWVAATGILLLYLHAFFTSGFWLGILCVFTLIYLFSARPYWYKWRFELGRPPWPSRVKFIAGRDYLPQNERTPYTYENYKARGGVILVVLFLACFYLRTENAVMTLILFIITLLVWRAQKISQKIQDGRINPELPVGKLRRTKRVIYSIIKKIPIIRPPQPQVHALRSVNLEIKKGMFGLLGPNGAGKTTLMRILVGVLEQNRGSIKINGLDLDEHRETFHGSIGYLPQEFGLYENMTPLEYLNYFAITNGIYEKQDREHRIENILRSVGLWERRDDKVKTFSGGMKQRVGIAQTLLHLPHIIVVDEPTAGLDPRERIRFRNLLSELAKERIVVFSTHIIEDISSTCKDLAVLNNGRVIFNGSPDELQQRASGLVYEADISEELFAQVQQRLKIIQHSKTNEGIHLRFISEETPPVEINANEVEPNLEDAYLYLLQKKKR